MTDQPPGPPYDFDPQKTRFLFDLDLKANGSRGEITEQEIAAFGRWLRAHKNDDIILYHGTSAKHAVMDNGLLPTSAKRRRSYQSGSGYVYLSYDPNRALTFAQFGYPMEQRFAVYAVRLPIKSLAVDVDQLANKRFYTEKPDIGTTLAHSLIYGAGARHKGRIEPWRISLHGIFDKNSQRIQEGHEHPMRRLLRIVDTQV